MTIVLVSLGLLVLASAGGANALRLGKGVYYFVERQSEYLVAGVVVCVCAALFDYRNWRKHISLTTLAYIIVFLLCLAVFLFKPINGSHRWIPIGPVRLQPSEIAKLLTVISVAVYIDRCGWKIDYFFRGALVCAVLIAFFAIPVAMEKDFGSAMVIGLAGMLMMFLGDVKLWHLAPFFALGAGGLAYRVLSEPNRVARIFAWSPTMKNWILSIVGNAGVSDTATERALHQGKMALVAISRGGVNGVGLGESMQKLYYLPEAHTDFVFAIGAEELGLWFSVAVVALYCIFFALAVYIAKSSCDRLGRNIAFGMAFIIFFQAMFNLAVVSGALPPKGMALPFFSYGGTNLVCAFFAVGTILSVGIRAAKEEKDSAK